MPKIKKGDSMDFKKIIEFINSFDLNAKERILEDGLKYQIYNGRLKEVIAKKLIEEFKNPKTVQQLINRIVPINIVRKSIDKLAKVYKNDPERTTVDLNPNDYDLIKTYESSFNLNHKMQNANQLFKLHKHVLLEPYLDSFGVPSLRVIPSHKFWLFSEDKLNPERATTIVIILNDDKEDKNKLYSVWTKDNHFLIDGRGNVNNDLMIELDNPEGINPYKVLPFVHINESSDNLYPIRPTDILAVQIVICLLLSDTCLAQKYLSWATLTITGGSGEENVEVGPASVINLPIMPDGSKPDVKYLQPNLNAGSVIELVDKLIEYFLYTNNLSAGQSIGDANSGGNASGIAKILDEAQSTEDKEEQKRYFEVGEKELWNKLAKNILPVWINSKKIDPLYAGVFSKDFELHLDFQDMKPMLTSKEQFELEKAQVELIVLKLKNNLITLKGALQELYPNEEVEKINERLSDIEESQGTQEIVEDQEQEEISDEEELNKEDGISN